jgi:hypothetical protein
MTTRDASLVTTSLEPELSEFSEQFDDLLGLDSNVTTRDATSTSYVATREATSEALRETSVASMTTRETSLVTSESSVVTTRTSGMASEATNLTYDLLDSAVHSLNTSSYVLDDYLLDDLGNSPLSNLVALASEARMSSGNTSDGAENLAFVDLLGTVNSDDDPSDDSSTTFEGNNYSSSNVSSVSLRSVTEIEYASLECMTNQAVARPLGLSLVYLTNGFIGISDLEGVIRSREQVMSLDDGLVSTLETTTEGLAQSVGNVTR